MKTLVAITNSQQQQKYYFASVEKSIKIFDADAKQQHVEDEMPFKLD